MSDLKVHGISGDQHDPAKISRERAGLKYLVPGPHYTACSQWFLNSHTAFCMNLKERGLYTSFSYDRQVSLSYNV